MDDERVASGRQEMAADLGGDATNGMTEQVMLCSPDGAWYELHRVDADRAAALEQAAAAAATDDVAGFSHGRIHFSGEMWGIGGHREWNVVKFTAGPDGALNGTHTLSLAPPPSVRFPGGLPTGG
jgi:hypothetical protein